MPLLSVRNSGAFFHREPLFPISQQCSPSGPELRQTSELTRTIITGVQLSMLPVSFTHARELFFHRLKIVADYPPLSRTSPARHSSATAVAM